LERALLTGESRGLLEDYFGPESYSQLRDLARDAATRSVRGGPRVLILPGIMGSTLARKSPLGIEDVLWINPVEIAVGRLSNLKLDGEASPYHASGVILLAYLKLKLRLKTAGFNADFFPFDWRRSLSEIAANLANAIEQDPAVQVSLVAHSIGGLAARMALRSAGAKVVRLIMLGTPNYGSFAPVQVIRATYDVIHKVAALDRRHTAEQLSEVFNTFPGLYEMLPAPEKFSAVDLYVAGSWPHRGPQPRADLLSKVKSVRNDLAPADSRFFLIAGVNQTTVVGLHPGTAEFQYELSSDGDGTVPVAFAELANMSEEQIYYVEESHGSLPNNGFVEAAVVDLLSRGATSALANQRPATRGAAETVSEKRVREMAQRAAGIGQLGTADYRHLLDSVVAAPRVEQAAERIALPPTAAAAAQGAGGLEVKLTQHFQNLTIGKRSQRRIELTLAHGSITDVDSRAYVLGVFRNVAPSGPATPIDRRLDGAVTEFTARRMLGGNVGSVFMIPVGRNQLAADMVLFLGLGPFDRFNADVQQLVSENVIRLLVRSRVDEFATILIGAGSGQSASAVVQNLLVGFFRGLHDADPRRRFRGLTLCEADPARFAEMRAEVYRLAGTSLFDEIELDLTEIEVPPTEPVTARVLEAGQEPVYMMIRQEGHTPNHLLYRVSVLGSGMKAAVVTAAKDIDQKKLAELLNEFDTAVGPNSSFKDVQSFGRQFSELLPREICTVLESMRDRHIVVVHDTEAARIPWETLTINDWSPALGAGLSRRYLADNLPVATWLEERRVQPILRLLLIVNPLGDLGGAEREGDRVLQLAKTDAGISVTPLRQKEASKAAVLAALRSGLYDCVHYAGHAFFDPQGPGRSGLLCAGQEVLRGTDLAGISNLPSLVFFNACEAGRVRGKLAKPSKKASEQAFESAGVAEALMLGGIANYMSTYWPVGDDAAETFAATFYKGALAGRTIGSALLAGRKNVQELGVRDWADYMLYGSFDFILKQSE
jgi:CHAT domain-containing protein/pimeloyl-ACP methyl ester carboxylesterase